MKENGWQSNIQKKWRPTKNKAVKETRPNLVQRNFTPEGPNQILVSDITYIHTLRDGWTYLCTFMDLYTRKAIGWSYGEHMDTDLVMTAFQRAIDSMNGAIPTIVHTDNGSQYISAKFEQALTERGIAHSYSAPGVPFDNAAMESFHASLKKAFVYHLRLSDYEHAQLALFQWVEGWYNRHRSHSTLGYSSFAPQKPVQTLTIRA
jgi:transposase InsO family protein